MVIFALFVGVYLFRAFRRKQLQLVYFNDIDSVYPLFLCLLMAFSATIYDPCKFLYRIRGNISISIPLYPPLKFLLSFSLFAEHLVVSGCHFGCAR